MEPVRYLPRTTPLRSAICPLRYVESVVRGVTLLSQPVSLLHTLRVVLAMGLTCGRWRSLPGNHIETNDSS